jgi:hypothetical protein
MAFTFLKPPGTIHALQKPTMKTDTAPVIEQVEMSEDDIKKAEKVAKRMGYEQYAYTSTSGLWGLFCLPENPQHSKGPRHGGCIILTKQFGMMFVQDLEDLHQD